MEKTITGAETPISFRGSTVIPIWEICLHYSSAAGITIFGSKKAVGAIIVNTIQTKAFGVNGKEISLEVLLHEVPGLKEILEKVQK
jgi:hypothetical protein